MAFERGEVVEILRPVWVDGELMQAGDMLELSAAEARDFKARRIARTPAEKGAKPSAKGKVA